MITTTTPTIEEKRIVEYKGIVFEVIARVNFIKDFAANITNIFGAGLAATKVS